MDVSDRLTEVSEQMQPAALDTVSRRFDLELRNVSLGIFPEQYEVFAQQGRSASSIPADLDDLSQPGHDLSGFVRMGTVKFESQSSLPAWELRSLSLPRQAS